MTKNRVSTDQVLPVAEFPAYTIERRLPHWLVKGRTQFHNQHGGPAEMAKGVLTQACILDQSFEDMVATGGVFFGRLAPQTAWEWTNAYTEELLDHLQTCCRDIVQVTWSCGFSFASEAVQRQIVTDFAQRARKRGIRVCAYLSLTNIFWQDAFDHEPFLEDLVAIDDDGMPILYAFSQARYLACLSRPEWLEYLARKMCLAIDEAEVDAVYFDNLTARCACDRCRERFAAFTQRLVGRSYDMPRIRRQRPTDTAATADEDSLLDAGTSREVNDGEQRFCRGYLYRRFQDFQIAEALRWLRDKAIAHKSNLLFTANNHLHPFVNDLCHVLYSQDTRRPGPDWNNVPVLRYLHADAEGWKPVITNHPLPEGGDPRLSMAEAVAFQSSPYQITLPPYNRFFRDHDELFTDVEVVAPLGVVLEYPKQYTAYLQPLAWKNFSYRVIAADKWSQVPLNRFRAILLPGLSTISDDLWSALRAYERSGGTLINVGDSGRHDGFGCPRSTVPTGETAIDLGSPMPDDVLALIRDACEPLPLRVEGPSFVVTNLVRRQEEDSVIIHILNYNDSPVASVRLHLNLPDFTCRTATAYSPDTDEASTLEVVESRTVTLRRIDVYTVIELKQN